MEHHVEIDVSLELSSLCILDATRKIVRNVSPGAGPSRHLPDPHWSVHRDRLQSPKASFGSCLPVAMGVRIQLAPGC